MMADQRHSPASYLAHVLHEDTEKRLRRMCDGNDPEFWLADGTWIDFRKHHAAGISAWLFLRHEKRLRNLARKYRAKPVLFATARDRFLESRARTLGLAYHKVEPPASHLPNRLSPHQLLLLQKLLPLMEYQRNSFSTDGLVSLLESLGLTPKKLLQIIRSLLSERAGRKRIDRYDKALVLFKNGSSFHQICVELDPDYATTKSGDVQRRARERMKSGIFRRLRRTALNTNGTK